jgi:hypothetical protein
MQYGYSKDHRPDMPQLKLMAAAAEPSGHLLASGVLTLIVNHASRPFLELAY